MWFEAVFEPLRQELEGAAKKDKFTARRIYDWWTSNEIYPLFSSSLTKEMEVFERQAWRELLNQVFPLVQKSRHW